MLNNNRDYDIGSFVIDVTTAAITYGPWIILGAKFMRGERIKASDLVPLIPSIVICMAR